MTYATPLKHERIELGLTLSVLSVLTGITIPLLSRAERGEYQLTYEKDTKLKKTLRDVRRLLSLLPYRPDVNDAQTLKRALDDLDAGKLDNLQGDKVPREV